MSTENLVLRVYIDNSYVVLNKYTWNNTLTETNLFKGWQGLLHYYCHHLIHQNCHPPEIIKEDLLDYDYKHTIRIETYS